MKRQMTFAAALLLCGFAHGGELTWTTSNWAVADFTDSYGHTITLMCKGVGLREFVYTLPEENVGSKLAARDTMDLMMVVKNRDDQESKKVGAATVERAAGMMSYRLAGQEAWSFMSGVAFSKEITVGLLTEGTVDDGKPFLVFKLNTYNGQTEDAAFGVLGACQEPEAEQSPITAQ